MKYKAIIFDFDGVIVDSVNIKTKAFAQIYSPFGQEVVQKVISHHELHGGISRFEKIAHYHKTFLNTELNEIELNNLAQEFSSLVVRKVINASYITGAKNFLEAFANHMSFFVATGTPQNEIEQITFNRQLTKYFNGIFGSPESKVSIISRILTMQDFSPSEVLFVGDALTDYNAAIEMKLDFVGVENSITKFPANTNLIKDLNQLKEFL